MADHSKPTLSSAYTDFVTELDGRFDDLAAMMDPAVVTVTNPPTNSVRWNSALAKFQKYNGASWVDLMTGGLVVPGGLNSTAIGATTASTGAFTTLSSNSTTTLGATTATSLNSTPIGSTTPSTGAFTTLSATHNNGFGLTVKTNDATAGNNAGVLTYSVANASSASRRSILFLDPNGGDGAGGDYVALDAYGNGTFTISNEIAGGNINLSTQGVTRATVSSTGLAVTGALSATGGVASQKTTSYGASADAEIVVGGTDNGFVNSGAASHWRQLVSGNENGQSLNIQAFLRGTGYTTRGVWSSTGLSVTGAVSATRTDGTPSLKLISDSGLLRARYIDATNGFAIESTNTGESAYTTLGLTGSRVRINTGTGINAALFDTAGNLGIGVTPYASVGGNGNLLQIGNPTTLAGSGLTIGSTTTGDLQFSDAASGAGQYAGMIRYSHSSDAMAFWTNSAERVSISSSGLFTTTGNATISGDLLGVGTSPAAWKVDDRSVAQIGAAGFWSIDAARSAWVSANMYVDSAGVSRYIGNGWAGYYASSGGAHSFAAFAENVSGAGASIPAGAITLNVTQDGRLQFNSGYGGVATAYGCRVWVNFNGTGTPAINGSGNVTSITDGGSGIFTINFTNAMPDANYSAAGICGNSSGYGIIYSGNSTVAAGSYQFQTGYVNGFGATLANVDYTQNYVVIHR